MLLAAVEEWGPADALPRFNGMFAIALWDTRDRALTLAKDRFGEKPLYYGLAGDCLLFASEPGKALRGARGLSAATSTAAPPAQFLRYAYVPTPRTIFEGVRKLPPGTSIRIAAKEDVAKAPAAFWSLVDVASERGMSRPILAAARRRRSASSTRSSASRSASG